MPTDIREEWGSMEGPVTVSFMLNGEKRTIHPLYQNDFIDVGIVQELNALIADSGYQFAVVHLDQTVFVTVLTAKEREGIEKDRFIEFEF
ncbi:hypothetical protein [Paenibacillus rigui]|nr:hypothetical protein [Paenibacillus rigui]